MRNNESPSKFNTEQFMIRKKFPVKFTIIREKNNSNLLYNTHSNSIGPGIEVSLSGLRNLKRSQSTFIN